MGSGPPMQYNDNGKRQNHLLSGRYRSIILILSVMPMPRISGKEQAIPSYAENTGLMMCTAGREGRQKGARGATTRGPAGEKEHGRVPEGVRGARPLRGGAKSLDGFSGR